MSQLTNAGYGDLESRGPGQDRLRLSPELETKLDTLPQDLANGLVAQAVALADAQGAQSTVGWGFLDAITNISN